MDSGSVFWFTYVSWNQVELLLLAEVSVTISVILVVFSQSCNLAINAFKRLCLLDYFFQIEQTGFRNFFKNDVDIHFIYSNIIINK